MRIEVEYKSDGMARISLLFKREGSDPEDHWIRSELERFPIPPKRTLEWERAGEPFEVLQYGQCVIGNLMYDIEKHQMVCQVIAELCAADLEASDASAEERERFIAETAREFHTAAKVSWHEDDTKFVVVDDEPLRARMLELLGSAAPS